MSGLIRRIIATTAIAAVATTGVAFAVASAAEPEATTTVSSGLPATSTFAQPPATRELGPIELTSIPESRRVGPTTAGEQRSTTQVIRLEVRGGELTLSPSSIEATLHRRGGRLVAELPEVTVVDARGSLEGWTLGARVVALELDASNLLARPGLVSVVPTRIEVVHGNEGAAELAPAGRGNRTIPVAAAAAGDGGGTFEVSAEIHVSTPGPFAGDGGTVRVALSVE